MFGIRSAQINVSFPALDNYVAYLRETDTTQKEIDAATATITNLTLSLKQSSSHLTAIVAAAAASQK